MDSVLNLTPEEAREFLLKRKRGAIHVRGLIDLRGAKRRASHDAVKQAVSV